MIQPTGNIEPGLLLARGLTAEIFVHSPDRVVKLYLSWMPREKVEREFAVTKAVRAAGVPVPNAFELVELNGRYGILFERIDGISMLRHTMRRPWRLIAAARQAAKLHAQIHSIPAPSDLPSQRQQIENWIAAAKDLSEPDRASAKYALANVPDGNAICHGDFHPENILFTRRGPIIIDWTTGTRGNPIGDAARTASLIRHAEIPRDWPLYMRFMISISRHFLVAFYTRRYFQLRPGHLTDLDPWEPIQKAAMSAWRARHENYV